MELTDRMVERGFGDHTALIGNGRQRTYKELADWTNRIAHALVEDYGVKPGNRVLIRSANNPAMVACWLAATKAGAVVVNTMPKNERHRNDLHRHPQYYAIRNHLVEFLVNRSKAFDQEIAAHGYDPRRPKLVKPGLSAVNPPAEIVPLTTGRRQ